MRRAGVTPGPGAARRAPLVATANQGMSADLTPLLAAIIGVCGVLAGLLVERLLRNMGRIWCEPTEWETHFEQRGADGFGKRTAIEVESLEEVTHAGYSVWLDFYNGKEIPIGLGDVSIVFSCDGGELVSKPLSTTSGRQVGMGGPVSFATMRSINLQPRQWVSVALHNDFTDPRDIHLLAGWRRAEFVGQQRTLIPWTGKTYQKTIAIRDTS
jgi:hypothetical protein